METVTTTLKTKSEILNQFNEQLLTLNVNDELKNELSKSISNILNKFNKIDVIFENLSLTKDKNIDMCTISLNVHHNNNSIKFTQVISNKIKSEYIEYFKLIRNEKFEKIETSYIPSELDMAVAYLAFIE